MGKFGGLKTWGLGGPPEPLLDPQLDEERVDGKMLVYKSVSWKKSIMVCLKYSSQTYPMK